jgi:hypothetical protein
MTGVQQPRNVWVGQSCQNLPLYQKALPQLGIVRTCAKELYGHALSRFPIRSFT